MIYKLEPIWKKSVTDIQHWYHKEKDLWFEQEVGWRWGSATFESEGFPEIDLKNEVPINVSEDLDDPNIDCDDGCWTYFNFSDKIDEDYQEQLKEMDFDELEKQGWYLEYVDTYFSGPLKLSDENGNEWEWRGE
jgi:hypothetical protein